VRVVDPAGNPVPGASVEIAGKTTGVIHRKTGIDGTVRVEANLAKAGDIVAIAEGLQKTRVKYLLNEKGEAEVEVRLLLPGHVEKIVVKESAGRRFWNWPTSCTR